MTLFLYNPLFTSIVTENGQNRRLNALNAPWNILFFALLDLGGGHLTIIVGTDSGAFD